MTVWINIIWLSVQLALFVLNKIKENQLIAQGEANALKELLDQSNVLIGKIQNYRADPVPGVVVRDEFDRDNDNPIIDIIEDGVSELLPGAVQQQSGQPADTDTTQAEQSDVDKSGV